MIQLSVANLLKLNGNQTGEAGIHRELRRGSAAQADAVCSVIKAMSRAPIIRILILVAYVHAGSGCSATAPTRPQTEVPKQDQGLIVSISSEPAVEVGDVVAAYVTVNVSSAEQVVINIPQAVTLAGDRDSTMSLYGAIDRAGGEKTLIAALPHVPSQAASTLELGSSGALKAVGSVLFLVPLAAPFAMYDSLNQINRDRLRYSSFGCGALLLRCEVVPDEASVDGPAEVKGYVFFPRKKYVALEVEVNSYFSGHPRHANARCPWL